ncbi:hypothetical protein GCM10009589_11990 [Arthrobacter pascens]
MELALKVVMRATDMVFLLIVGRTIRAYAGAGKVNREQTNGPAAHAKAPAPH